MFNGFSDLQVMANRKKEIDDMNLDPQAKQRLLGTVTTKVGLQSNLLNLSLTIGRR